MAFSGEKEYNANVYPEEPVKKLWSLLKMNDKDYSLSSSKTPQVPLKRGSIGEISKGEDLTLVISQKRSGSEIKSQGSASVRGSPEKKSVAEKDTTKTRKDVSVSKEGPQVTNVNISISIDSHSSYGNFSSSDKKKKSRRPSGELSLNGSNRKNSKSVQPETLPKRQSVEPQFSGSKKIPAPNGSTTLPTEEKAKIYQSTFPPEITPQSRAKSLSKHLSGSSLHKTSFKVRERKPSSDVTENPELVVVSVRKPSLSSEKKRSNNSADGIGTFVLPTESPRGSIKSDQKLENIQEQKSGQIGSRSSKTSSTSPKKPAEANVEPKITTESAGVYGTDPLSLDGLKPLPQPPSDVMDRSAPHVRRSGEIKNRESQDESTPRPQIVEETHHDNTHGEIKDLVSETVLEVGAGPADHAEPNTYESKSGQPSDVKLAKSREEWNPNEVPPSIRVSDVDVASSGSKSNKPVQSTSGSPPNEENELKVDSTKAAVDEVDPGKATNEDNKLKVDSIQSAGSEGKKLTVGSGKAATDVDNQLKRDSGNDTTEEETKVKVDSVKVTADEDKKLQVGSGKSTTDEENKLKVDSMKATADEDKKLQVGSGKSTADEENKLKVDSVEATADEDKKLQVGSGKAATDEEKELKVDSVKATADEDKKLQVGSGKSTTDEEKELKVDSVKATADEDKKLEVGSGKSTTDEENKLKVDSVKATADEDKKLQVDSGKSGKSTTEEGDKLKVDSAKSKNETSEKNEGKLREGREGADDSEQLFERYNDASSLTRVQGQAAANEGNNLKVDSTKVATDEENELKVESATAKGENNDSKKKEKKVKKKKMSEDDDAGNAEDVDKNGNDEPVELDANLDDDATSGELKDESSPSVQGN